LLSGKKDLKKYPNFGDQNAFVERVNGRDSVFVNSNPNLQKFSGYRQIDVLEKLLFVQNNALRHTFNVQYSNSTDVPRYDRLTEKGSNGKPKFAEWYYGPQQRFMASYQMEYRSQKGIADLIRFTPSFQKVQESRHDRRLNAATRNDRTENIDLFALNIDFFKLIKKQEIRYGAEFTSNELKSEGVKTDVNSLVTTPIASRYPSGNYRTYGAFIAHRWEILGKKFILSDGLRFSGVAMNVLFDAQFYQNEKLRTVSQTSNSLNYNLGFASNWSKGTRFAALISTGFRNPNIDDAAKIFENANKTLNIPNSNLKPEQVLHREISISQKLGNIAELSSTVFFSSLSNAIATRPTTFEGNATIVYNNDTLGLVQSTNVAKAEVKGISFRGKVRFATNFTLTGLVQYVKGRDLTANIPLDHIPPMTVNIRFGYTQNRWSAETDVLYNAWKRIADYSPSGEDNQQYATPEGMPAWSVWNVRAAYKFTSKLRLQAGIENILDTNYRVFASGINGGARSFVVGVYYQ
jgi:hemoglobin/transferrin/lactoferrin receptor protein